MSIKKYKKFFLVLLLFMFCCPQSSLANENNLKTDVDVQLLEGNSEPPTSKPKEDNVYPTEDSKNIKSLPQTGELVSMFIITIGLMCIFLFLLILFINKIIYSTRDRRVYS